MANIMCGECTGKSTSHLPGYCVGEPGGVACNKPTTTLDYKLCSSCAERFQQCRRCLKSLVLGGTGNSTAANVYFVQLSDRDAGVTVTLRVGERLRITLQEDSGSGAEWDTKSLPSGFSNAVSSKFFTHPGTAQYGQRVFVLAVGSSAAGKSVQIEIHEVTRRTGGFYGGSSGGVPIVGGRKWSCTVNVKAA